MYAKSLEDYALLPKSAEMGFEKTLKLVTMEINMEEMDVIQAADLRFAGTEKSSILNPVTMVIKFLTTDVVRSVN